MSEQATVERARRGDREAFDRIVTTNLAHVWRVVWRVLRHREDTEDVVQEVFLAAYQGLAGFRGEAKLSTWLQRIAVTRALNHLDRAAEKVRRASRPFEVQAGDPDAGVGAEPQVDDPSRVTSPLQALEAKELRRRLTYCLSRLPPAWRAALTLRDGDHRSYDDIATALGIALGTVRSRLARARLALRRCVEGEAS
jgi:RNA polymerase sigma-70 factor (ECF subfamily)